MMNRKQRRMLTRIVITLVLTAGLLVTDWVSPAWKPTGLTRFAAYLVAYLIIGHDILRKALHGVMNGRAFDENFLMTAATVGVFALALYGQSGDYMEAVAVMLFYQIGEFFQSYAVGKSRTHIAGLMNLSPESARVERDGQTVETCPDEVARGEIIVVHPGERVPIDGVVLTGESTLNMADLTGESLPRTVGPGTEIVSGSINQTGVLRIRTTREYGQSTATKIMELVEDSATRKSKSENFIAKFARIYTPAVCGGALALALLPPLCGIIFGTAAPVFASFEPWIYRALVFLVISCPCALVVSIPLTFFAGIGGASRRNILVKGANILETLSKVKTVVFDKTGTLTRGVFEVAACHDADDKDMEQRKGQLLEYAALAEAASSHPIGSSLLQAYGRKPDRRRIGGVKELSGRGVCALIDGKQVAAGNEKLMRDLGVTPCPCATTGTIVHVAVDGTYAGHIVLGDVVKPTARQAVNDLRRAGVTQTVMLTGDTRAVAEQTAAELGIDKVYSELLPAGKVERLEHIINTTEGNGKVAFAGDGMNDAPVLVRADVGIAMGALGSDAAIEAADVVLMDDDPLKIGRAIVMARKCMRIVWQNILMVLGVKGICLTLGVFGIVNMWPAVFADVGVMVTAVLNAVRALHYHNGSTHA